MNKYCPLNKGKRCSKTCAWLVQLKVNSGGEDKLVSKCAVAWLALLPTTTLQLSTTNAEPELE